MEVNADLGAAAGDPPCKILAWHFVTLGGRGKSKQYTSRKFAVAVSNVARMAWTRFPDDETVGLLRSCYSRCYQEDRWTKRIGGLLSITPSSATYTSFCAIAAISIIFFQSISWDYRSPFSRTAARTCNSHQFVIWVGFNGCWLEASFSSSVPCSIYQSKSLLLRVCWTSKYLTPNGIVQGSQAHSSPSASNERNNNNRFLVILAFSS